MGHPPALEARPCRHPPFSSTRMTIPIVAPGSQDDLLSFAGPGRAFRRQGHAVRPFARDGRLAADGVRAGGGPP